MKYFLSLFFVLPLFGAPGVQLGGVPTTNTAPGFLLGVPAANSNSPARLYTPAQISGVNPVTGITNPTIQLQAGEAGVIQVSNSFIGFTPIDVNGYAVGFINGNLDGYSSNTVEWFAGTPGIRTAVNWDGTNFYVLGGAVLGRADAPWTGAFINGLSLAGATNTATNILYVHPQGFNVGIRGNSFAPWNNISNACVAATNGDTILISGSNNITPVGSFIAAQMDAAILLRMKSNITIRGLGNDARIHGDGVGNFMVLEDTRNITIENLAFTGNRPAIVSDLFLAIGLCGTNANTRVLNCRFSNLGEHGIGVGRNIGNGLKNHSGALISGNLFENVGGGSVGSIRDGAAIQAGRDGWVIVNNVFTNVLRGIEFEGDYLNLSTNHIVNGNLIHTLDMGVLIWETADGTNQYRNIRITGNTFSGSATNIGVNIMGLTDGVVSGNSFQGGQYHIILGSSVGGSTNNLIENNTFLPTYTSGAHIILQADTGHLILGTVVRNNLFRSDPSTTVKAVNVDGPNAINTTIAGNTFYWFNDYAIRLGGFAATNTLVTGNYMPDSGIYGTTPLVKVESGAKDTLIYGNINLTNAAGTVLGGVSNLSTTTRIFGQYTGTNAFALASNLWATGTNIMATNLTLVDSGSGSGVGGGTFSFGGFTNLGGSNFMIVRSNSTRILIPGSVTP